MADNANKVTLFINDQTGGWTENFYVGELGLSSMKDYLDQFRLKRAQVLGSGCSIVLTKFGDTARPRLGYKFRSSIDGLASDISGNQTGVGRYADSRDATALMPCRTASGTLRNINCGGIPDAWIAREATKPGDFGITDIGATALLTWYNYLLKSPGQLLIRQRLRSGDFAEKGVTDITEGTDGRYSILTTEDHALVAGDKVSITKYKGNNLKGVGGIRKVYEKLAPDRFTIDSGPRSDLGDVTLTFACKYAKVGYSYDPAINSPEPFIATTRQRGRGFAQRRGRRSAKR